MEEILEMIENHLYDNDFIKYAEFEVIVDDEQDEIAVQIFDHCTDSVHAILDSLVEEIGYEFLKETNIDHVVENPDLYSSRHIYKKI